MRPFSPPFPVAVLGALLGCALFADSQTTLEYEVKAAYLYNFAKFVTWPSDNAGPITICVMGKDPFGSTLDETVQGKNVRGQSFQVRRLRLLDQPQGCQIAFLAASDNAWEQTVHRDNWLGILLVGEGYAFVKQGGMIGLVLRDGHVRFDVNLDALARSHLEVSSKLLQMATVVVPE